MHFQCITVYSKISKMIFECLPHFDCRIYKAQMSKCYWSKLYTRLFSPWVIFAYYTFRIFLSFFKRGTVFLFKNILKKENFAQFKICPLLKCLYMLFWSSCLLYSLNCFILYSEDEWSWRKIDVTFFLGDI